VTLNILDVVVLNRDIPTHGLKRGTWVPSSTCTHPMPSKSSSSPRRDERRRSSLCAEMTSARSGTKIWWPYAPLNHRPPGAMANRALHRTAAGERWSLGGQHLLEGHRNG
jgi:hypothetical protein